MNWLICPGASKSGSTWLYGLLKQHPALAMSIVKETRFFTYDCEKGFNKYQKMFPEFEKHHQYACDFSPIYLIDPTVPEKIYRTLGSDVRFIFLFRHPIERLYSQYHMDVRFGFEHVDLMQAVQRDPSDRRKISLKNFKHPYGNDYIGESLYDQALERYLAYFDVSQMHIIIFEDLTQNPAQELKRLFEFLSIEDLSHKIDYSINKGQSKVYTRNQFLIKGYVKYFNRIAFIKKILAQPHIRQWMKKLIGHQYQKNPPIAENQKQQLKSYFSDTITYIEKMTGKVLDQWRS